MKCSATITKPSWVLTMVAEVSSRRKTDNITIDQPTLMKEADNKTKMSIRAWRLAAPLRLPTRTTSNQISHRYPWSRPKRKKWKKTNRGTSPSWSPATSLLPIISQQIHPPNNRVRVGTIPMTKNSRRMVLDSNRTKRCSQTRTWRTSIRF